MKKTLYIFLSCLFFGSAFSAIQKPGSAGFPRKNNSVALDRSARVLPDKILVKRIQNGLAKNSKGWEQALQKVSAIKTQSAFPSHARDNTRLSQIFHVHLAPGTNVFDACEILMRDAFVEWAEPVYSRKIDYTPNDPGFASQWYLTTIRAKEAWDVSRSAQNVVIAVVDNGIQVNHPDLAANIWVNTKEIPGNRVDDDRNDFTDDVRGWDFGNDDADPSPGKNIVNDLKWHGTGVAGIAGAVTDNGKGMASAAFNPKIMPIKAASDSDPQYVIAGYQGIVYAADNGADFINCSFGASSPSQGEKEAVDYANSIGCLVLAAAGNDNGEIVQYPAGLPGVFSVAATNQNDTRTVFSNYGYSVDASAPGIHIYSIDSETNYGMMDGTSFCTPITASVAALVKGLHPTWTGVQAGEQVRVSAASIDALNPGLETKLGRGRVDAYQALTLKSPSIRLDSTSLVEGPGGNADGVNDPGEELIATFFLTNWLEPASNVTIVLSCTNPNITLLNSNFLISSLGTLKSWNNRSNPMRIQISPSAARGQNILIKVEIQAGGGYRETERIQFDIPAYITLHGKNAALTLTDMGRLGLADINTEQGEGFIYRDEGSLLFEGAVMAGISADTLSDVARGTDGIIQNSDFHAVQGGDLIVDRPGILADQQGRAGFSDGTAVPSLHLGVRFSAFAYADSLNGDYILLAYKLYNTSASSIRKLYFGLFMDWDINGGQDSWHNLAGYDPSLNLGYVYEKLSSVYGGLAVVSGGAGAYRSLVNGDVIYPDVGGYSKKEKWDHLSGGVLNAHSTTETDFSQVLGVGPFDINPKDTILVGFAVAGGSGLEDLKRHVEAAKVKWQTLFKTTGIPRNPQSAMIDFRLEPCYPNPFNSETVIRFDLPNAGPVVLTVLDLSGREVARLIDSAREAGRHEVRWNGKTLDGRSAASGVYFVRIQAGERNTVRKLTLLR